MTFSCTNIVQKQKLKIYTNFATVNNKISQPTGLYAISNLVSSKIPPDWYWWRNPVIAASVRSDLVYILRQLKLSQVLWSCTPAGLVWYYLSKNQTHTWYGNSVRGEVDITPF